MEVHLLGVLHCTVGWWRFIGGRKPLIAPTSCRGFPDPVHSLPTVSPPSYMFFNQTWELSFCPKPKYKIDQNLKIKYWFHFSQKFSRKTCRKLKAALLWQSWQMVFWRRRLYWCVIASLQICQISQTSSYFISKKGNFSLETYLDFKIPSKWKTYFALAMAKSGTESRYMAPIS